jgi:hypothetical protein
MNKTMIVGLIAVSLGALLPVPSAQALDLANTCASDPAVMVDEIIDPYTSLHLTGDGGIDYCLGEVGNPGIPQIPDEFEVPDPDPTVLRPCEEGIGIETSARAYCFDKISCPKCDGIGGAEPPAGYDCRKGHDDNGMGGTHVSCEYDCVAGDELAIYVEADDTSYGTAEADGHTECGGAEADCDVHPSKNICTGASKGPATEQDYDADCNGESHETFDDYVTVACYAVGPSVICKLVPSAPGCNPELASRETSRECILALPAVPSSDLVDGLLQNVPPEAGSFLAFQFNQTSGFVIGSRIGADNVVFCWAGPF